MFFDSTVEIGNLLNKSASLLSPVDENPLKTTSGIFIF